MSAARKLVWPSLEIERPKLFIPGRQLYRVRPQLRVYPVPEVEPVVAAWSHVQDTPGSNAVASGSGSPLNLGAFGSPVTINDFVVVFTWGGGSSAPTAGQITCSDNGATPNSYTQLIFKNQAASNCYACIFVAQITSNPSSGNLNPKVSNAAGSAFIVACAAEFSGGTTTTDGSSSNSNTNNVNNIPSCGTMTTTVANDLGLACAGMDQGANLSSITDPSGYTHVGETTSSAVMAGSGVYNIFSGTVTNNNPTWTFAGASSSTTEGWAAVQAALEPPAAAGGGVYFLCKRFDPRGLLDEARQRWGFRRRLPGFGTAG